MLPSEPYKKPKELPYDPVQAAKDAQMNQYGAFVAGAAKTSPLSAYANVAGTPTTPTPAVSPEITEINKAQDYQEQQAYTEYQTVLKYLKLANQAQGVKGVSQGDLIQTGNNYQNALGMIGSEYESLRSGARQTAEAQATTDKKESDALAAAEAERWMGNITKGIEFKYDVMEKDSDGNISWEDYQKLVSYYQQNVGRLNDATKDEIQFMLDTFYPHTEAPQVDEKQSGETWPEYYARTFVNKSK